MASGKIKEHAASNKVTYMINLLTLVVISASAYSVVQQVATDEEVNLSIHQALESHSNTLHPGAQKQIDDIKSTLDKITMLQLQGRIESLLKMQCENPGLATSLAGTINEMIQEYELLAHKPYQRLPCNVLVGALQ